MTGTQYPGEPRDSNQLDDDLYAVLGVSPDAEIGELTSAYPLQRRPDCGETPAGPPTAPRPVQCSAPGNPHRRAGPHPLSMAPS